MEICTSFSRTNHLVKLKPQMLHHLVGSHESPEGISIQREREVADADLITIKLFAAATLLHCFEHDSLVNIKHWQNAASLGGVVFIPRKEAKTFLILTLFFIPLSFCCFHLFVVS